MTDHRQSDDSILTRLTDLEHQRDNHHRHTESAFLNEEEQAEARQHFPESAWIRYEGGYPGARKKKVIFPVDEEDDFSDIVCLKAAIDQRFRTISHRDILGALMSLQIERSSLGDFWISEDQKWIYLYTSHQMAEFLMDHLTRIANLSVSFERTEERPIQVHHTKEITVIAASERADALVASLAHVSRSKARDMIRQGHVQLNHVTLEKADELCNNDVTISIRGCGRFTYQGVKGHTRKDRIAAVFLQDV